MPVIETKGAASSGGFGQFAQRAEGAYIEDVFSTYLYAGNGSTQTITNGINLLGKNGMVWLKSRSSSDDTGGGSPPGYGHGLFDTLRGRTKVLRSETTAAELVYPNAISSFNTTGFSFGDATYNFSNQNFVSWTFRKQAKFFDVVTYTGNGTGGRTIAHSLGSVPGCIIVKGTTYGSNWTVYHRSLGAGNRLRLDETSAAAAAGQTWGSTTPTSTVFTVGGEGLEVNNSGQTYVAYLFAHDAGGFGASGTDNVITCGSFTTPLGSATSINLGYEPQWLLVKATSTTDDWLVADNMRGFQGGSPTGSGNPVILRPNTSQSEGSVGQFLYLESTGFNVQPGVYSVGTQFIYIAIRRGPMKTPTSGTSVFGANLRSATTVNGTDVTAPSPLPTAGDWFWLYNRGTLNDLNSYPATWARLIGGNALSPQNTNTETGSVLNYGYGQTAIRFTSTWDGAAKSYVQYFFRRAPGFFDVVCWTGNGTSQNLSHNLQVAPTLIFCKQRSLSGESWATLCSEASSSPDRRRLFLNSASAGGGLNSYFSNAGGTPVLPTSSVFTVGPNDSVNTSGQKYVAYLFATLTGVSKVGAYTGTGVTQQINCGFTGGARYVMIKRTDSTGDWYVWDSARGIVAGDDPYLLLNSTAAEVTNTDYIDTLSSGFEISSTAPAAINANGGSYIFLAIA